MFGLGVQELLLILFLVLIFFGAEKIPQLARSLGKGMSEFKKAQKEIERDIMGEEKEECGDAYGTVPDTSYAVSLSCPSCTTSIPAGSKFCPECGAKVEFNS